MGSHGVLLRFEGAFVKLEPPEGMGVGGQGRGLRVKKRCGRRGRRVGQDLSQQHRRANSFSRTVSATGV